MSKLEKLLYCLIALVTLACGSLMLINSPRSLTLEKMMLLSLSAAAFVASLIWMRYLRNTEWFNSRIQIDTVPSSEIGGDDLTKYIFEQGKRKFDVGYVDHDILVLPTGEQWLRLKVFMDFCKEKLTSDHLIHFYTPNSRISEEEFAAFLVLMSTRGVRIVYTFIEESAFDLFWEERKTLEERLSDSNGNGNLENLIGLLVDAPDNLDAHQAIIFTQEGDILHPYAIFDTSPNKESNKSHYYMKRKISMSTSRRTVALLNVGLDAEHGKYFNGVRGAIVLGWVERLGVLKNKNIAQFKNSVRSIK